MAIEDIIRASEIYKNAFRRLVFAQHDEGLSRKNSNISSSVTLEIAALAKKMKAEGEDVISFSAGEPDFKTPKNIRDEAIRVIEEGLTGYTAASGIIELKKAIVNKFSKDNHLSYKPENIIVSCGAKHSLFNALQAICNPGDEVIIPLPYWVSYPDLVKMADATPVCVALKPENGFAYNNEDLEAVVTDKTRAIIINSPNNPTGAVYDEATLKMIYNFAKKHELIIISDEIYEELVYDGKHISIASLSEDAKERTIVVNGMSKGYAMTGWRIGYAAAATKFVKVMANFQSHSTSNPNTIAQYASVEALTGPQDEVKRFRTAFDERRKYMVERLKEIQHIHSFEPSGAFYVMVDVKAFYGKTWEGEVINNSSDFCRCLLQAKKVASIPGLAFGVDDYVRFSYAISIERIEEGLNRFEHFLNSLK
ncbi:MAG: pyridoxal phosphate-dependent aminotransferase [Vallitaleaceae bacterium]|nr:pyridoxal phosphate-dependent aminotransferase [Vallitaleaceae bacterium]